MLCPAFLRKFICQPLCRVPLQIQTSYQNLVFGTEYHVDRWQTFQWHVTSAVTNFRCHKLIANVNNQKSSDTKNYLQRVWGKTSHSKHWKYQNLWMNNKIRGECNMLAFFSVSAEYLQKFEILISQGIVATWLRWGGLCHMVFVSNFISFPAMQKCWESVKIWQS